MAKDTISIGFEDKIWKAADVLRGNLIRMTYVGKSNKIVCYVLLLL